MSQKVLKFAQESIDFEFSGESYKIRFPTALELLDYTDKTKKIPESDIRKILESNHEFLETLGLPKSISKKLSTGQTKELFKVLAGN